MKIRYKIDSYDGFSVVETFLILVVIGIIGGAGYWVFTQRKTVKPAANISQSSQQVSSTPAIDPKQVGTTTGVNQVTSQELKDEESSDSSSVNGYKSSALSTSTAQNNIGDSFNESSY